MHWVHAVIFGVAEGLTEFLPISSTGHLILTARVLGLPQTETMKSFEIAIQLGAISAVVWIYWRSFLVEWKTLKHVLAAFLPTAFIGFLLYGFIKQFLFAGETIVLWALALGGFFLIFFDRFHQEKKGEISFSKAVGIGLIQSVAVIPGVSRSGATIVGGLFLEIDRKKAVEFSFLLAVPTILAATTFDLLKNKSIFAQSDWGMLLLGGFVSFIVALVSIRFFLRLIQRQKHALLFFGIYRIFLAITFWIFVK
jgi:undecaprenyl-diphosphatase